MMIRSASTPILGSLLPSSSSSFTLTDSRPSCIIHHPESCHAILKPPPHLPSTNKHYSFHRPLSCTSSPISPSISDLDRQKKGLIRRVQSEGNLEDLAYTCYNNNTNKEDTSFNYAADPPNPNRYSGRHRCLALETIPSFSLSKHTGLRQEEEDEDEDDVESQIEDEDEVFSVLDSLSEDVKVKLNRVCSTVVYGEEIGTSKEMMYLAKGLGLDGGCRGGNNGGGPRDYNSMGSGGNDGDSNNNHHEVEEYYKNMVDQNPGNPLFLRNYAQFLYQCKEDREGAMEYYSRAILADPKDGEVLSQYGKLVWELHEDQERASSYFERAVQASPEDSHVHAAYASFLWDTEEEEDQDAAGGCNQPQYLPSQFHLPATPTGV